MTARRARRDATALAAGLVLVGATVAGLHLLGRGVLAPPSVGALDELGSWAADRGPVTVGLVLLRLAALGVAYHLIATTALGLVGRLLHRPSLSGWAARATLPIFRSTVRRVAGLGLSASAVLVTPLPIAGATPAPTVEPVILQRLAPEVAGPESVVVLERVAPTPAPTGVASLRVLPPEEPSEPPAEAHLVRSGDHLWGLAEHRLADHLGRAPTDAEVGPYWRQVVAANPQLDDPDLLFPGDTVRIPPVTPPPAPGPAAGQATLRRTPG